MNTIGLTLLDGHTADPASATLCFRLEMCDGRRLSTLCLHVPDTVPQLLVRLRENEPGASSKLGSTVRMLARLEYEWDQATAELIETIQDLAPLARVQLGFDMPPGGRPDLPWYLLAPVRDGRWTLEQVVPPAAAMEACR
ncbi:MAG: hypothetical protein KDC87_16355 [Planctomycetes bacterium]|nr:hypothetical protein [Planctomycetota bacterium]MCB9870401.1 hypothetical protein [Planctomycetota bacterium]MCB9889392.1 hypothetical protein [Planctomycetota bacterium]